MITPYTMVGEVIHNIKDKKNQFLWLETLENASKTMAKEMELD